MCEGEKTISYHNHKGFWAIPTHIWSRDGVHPNTKLGRAKYIASLRKAIFQAVGKICREN